MLVARAGKRPYLVWGPGKLELFDDVCALVRLGDDTRAGDAEIGRHLRHGVDREAARARRRDGPCGWSIYEGLQHRVGGNSLRTNKTSPGKGQKKPRP